MIFNKNVFIIKKNGLQTTIYFLDLGILLLRMLTFLDALDTNAGSPFEGSPEDCLFFKGLGFNRAAAASSSAALSKGRTKTIAREKEDQKWALPI